MKLIIHRNKGGMAFKGRTQGRFLPWTLFLVTALFVAIGAQAQMYAPVHIGTAGGICDEFGNLLRGSAAMDAKKRDLVQVLWASNSVIHPPAYDGSPHPDNAPVENGTIGIGHLVTPHQLTPARFAAALSNPRPPQNAKIFVRVFNAPTAGQASFYSDSQLLTVRNNDILIAEFVATTNAIDPRDPDGDGLNNSWEKSLYSDPNKWDSDGDGINDADEFLSGTDLLDSGSLFVTVWLAPDENGNAVLTWDSVPGKIYQIQRTDFGDASLSYSNVSSTITADAAQTETTVTNGMSAGTGKYRVRLITDRQL